jgi:hypothetical protein
MWGGRERNTKVKHSVAGEDGHEDKLYSDCEMRF